MKFRRLLSDWMLVKLEPRQKVSLGGIVLPHGGTIRTGEVLMAGPGRQHRDRFVPMDPDIVGKRVAFFVAAVSGHQQGQTLLKYLGDDQGLIRQSDILLFLEGDVSVQ